jgi:hypothetical protein
VSSYAYFCYPLPLILRRVVEVSDVSLFADGCHSARSVDLQIELHVALFVAILMQLFRLRHEHHSQRDRYRHYCRQSWA